jgi:hypothetical protein
MSMFPETYTAAQLAKAIRARRTALLVASDWVVTRAAETGAAVPQEWATYRQALRAITEQPGFPTDVVWPLQP